MVPFQLILACESPGPTTHNAAYSFGSTIPFCAWYFPFLVPVPGLADFVRLKEEDLAQPFVGVNSRGQRRGVGDFQRDEAFPLRVQTA